MTCDKHKEHLLKFLVLCFRSKVHIVEVINSSAQTVSKEGVG
jgi:hypothetical protein